VIHTGRTWKECGCQIVCDSIPPFKEKSHTTLSLRKREKEKEEEKREKRKTIIKEC